VPTGRQADPLPASLPILHVPGWLSMRGLVHGFCGRRGGVSRGVYRDLNLSRRVGDELPSVEENWRRIAATLGGTFRFATMQQVHGDHIVTVTEERLDAGPADAAITASIGVLLSVLTADCVPVLMVAPVAHIAAAVHAGWRGTLAGIVPHTVERLCREHGVSPKGLHVALGPAIDGCCYEVDMEIGDSIESRWGALPEAVRRVSGGIASKAMVDLRGVNIALLRRAGVPHTQIASIGPCTRCSPDGFFSHRGAGGVTGRQGTFIGWKE
jgi:purine-nucleoside/S-methyl-5'-thioadenosine phosphorylase / adenosine deaminase